MLERVPLPIGRRVADLAFRPEAFLVIIVFDVAVIAPGGRLFEQLRLMTFRAADFFMFSEKGKRRLLMVESLDLLPRFFKMAILA